MPWVSKVSTLKDSSNNQLTLMFTLQVFHHSSTMDWPTSAGCDVNSKSVSGPKEHTFWDAHALSIDPALLSRTAHEAHPTSTGKAAATDPAVLTLDVAGRIEQPPHIVLVADVRNNFQNLRATAQRISFDDFLHLVQLAQAPRGYHYAWRARLCKGECGASTDATSRPSNYHGAS